MKIKYDFFQEDSSWKKIIAREVSNGKFGTERTQTSSFGTQVSMDPMIKLIGDTTSPTVLNVYFGENF